MAVKVSPMNWLMSRFRKEQVRLGGFARLMVGMLIDATPPDVSSVGTDFSDQERTLINQELDTFRFVVLYFLFLDEIEKGRLQVPSAEQLWRVLSHATVLAYRDKGYADDRINQRMEWLTQALDEYMGALNKHSDKELEEKGAFCHLCRHFSEKVLPKRDPNNELGRLKEFDAFDFSKQVYQGVRDVMREGLKQAQILPLEEGS